MKYDLAVVIGRFQPFHVGHERIVRKALSLARRVLVLVGSANRHRSVKNPFTFSERRSMIEKTFYDQQSDSIRIRVDPINDYPYNDDRWMTEVRRKINSRSTSSKEKVCIVGFMKDASSAYVKMFPEYAFEEITEQYGTFNATDIRESYFRSSPVVSTYLPTPVYKFLHDEFVYTQEFKWLLDEYQYVREYLKSWSTAPFPPVFVTVDNIVVQSGFILLVTRKEAPYKGALALPGGFISQSEKLIDSTVRELKEETKISDHKGEIPPAMLKSYITDCKIYDDPARSDRGRTITHGFLFRLPDRERLFEVIGNDDAEKAAWYPLSSIDSTRMMEDHAFIIEDMLGIELNQ